MTRIEKRQELRKLQGELVDMMLELYQSPFEYEEDYEENMEEKMDKLQGRIVDLKKELQ